MLSKVKDLSVPAASEEKRPHILIVDDDPAVRDLVSVLLQRRGMRVDTAEDGERAVACIAAQRYDVILLDLLMPRLDGQGVIRYMREAGRTDPVIVLSAALDEPVTLDPAIVRVAMRKPLVIDDLSTVIKAIIETARRAAAEGAP